MEPNGPKPFLFDKSFDLTALKAAEEAKKVKTYSEEEVRIIREQAYGEGLVAGKTASQQDCQQQQNVILGNISRLFERFAGEVWNVYTQQRQVATDVAVSIARKIVPDYVRKSGIQEITGIIESCVAEMINEPRLVLRINETQFDSVKGAIDQITSKLGYAGKMIILADQNVAENDCRLEWADGGMERNVNITWSEIEKQIARHGGGPANVAASSAAHKTDHHSSTTTIAV